MAERYRPGQREARPGVQHRTRSRNGAGALLAKPGGWVVFEVWESREAQSRFMNERLGRALQEGGVSEPPSRVEWLELAAYQSPAG
jgi:hypothetical protein